MPIVSVRNNENNIWKRNAKTTTTTTTTLTKTKTEKNNGEKGRAEALVKGSELNGFVDRFS